MQSLVPQIFVAVFGLATVVFLLAMVSAAKRKRIVDAIAVSLIGYCIYYNYSKNPPRC